MKKGRMLKSAGVYAAFQMMMPLIGWFLVKTVAEMFTAFHAFIPWIALILLLFIGGKMILEGIQEKKQSKKEKDGQQEKAAKLTFSALIVQGIATSIDALSVGFTIADYPVIEALLSALIIGVVTLAICFVGLAFGKRIGNKFSSTATIIGGAILIFIGIEVFVRGIFGL
jgi:putative Mn2+ efflux pump MntP